MARAGRRRGAPAVLRRGWALMALAAALALHAGPALARGHRPPEAVVAVAALPAEARATLALIDRGGPFPYPRDGVAFGNRERRLPPRPRGYYREYTVPTPGVQGRGARRIVAGRQGERWYTGDHYRTFLRIQGSSSSPGPR